MVQYQISPVARKVAAIIRHESRKLSHIRHLETRPSLTVSHCKNAVFDSVNTRCNKADEKLNESSVTQSDKQQCNRCSTKPLDLDNIAIHFITAS